MNPRPRILITGPGGRVGPPLLPLLRPAFALRLLDVAPPTRFTPEADDEFVAADIRDLPALRQACAGVQALIHLAAIPEEADFHSRLLPVNVEGTYNAFEAARQAGVRKVIFASTGQTVLGYPAGEWVDPDQPPRPSSVYACTKLFGEALARHYADVHGLQTIVIRLCMFEPYDCPRLREPGPIQREWCSPGDLARLLLGCLRNDPGFAIFFGVSNNSGRFWSIENARKLVGYEPIDNAADYLSDSVR